ncbi:hypothetical protein IFO70_09080 [Phormidium tenue FACHB-886]|nr:hypothetical protein [Phormidium tenue FACHB-886]
MATKAFQTSSSPTRQSKPAHAIASFAASMLVAAPAFGIQPANAAQPFSGCLQAGQRSFCDAPAHISAAPAAENPAPNLATAPIAHTALINPTIDKQLADILLGICYIGLPVGVTLAILLHDKHTYDRDIRLKAQVALLERIWKQVL